MADTTANQQSTNVYEGTLPPQAGGVGPSAFLAAASVGLTAGLAFFGLDTIADAQDISDVPQLEGGTSDQLSRIERETGFFEDGWNMARERIESTFDNLSDLFDGQPMPEDLGLSKEEALEMLRENTYELQPEEVPDEIREALKQPDVNIVAPPGADGVADDLFFQDSRGRVFRIEMDEIADAEAKLHTFLQGVFGQLQEAQQVANETGIDGGKAALYAGGGALSGLGVVAAGNALGQQRAAEAQATQEQQSDSQGMQRDPQQSIGQSFTGGQASARPVAADNYPYLEGDAAGHVFAASAREPSSQLRGGTLQPAGPVIGAPERYV